jgi:uncharacterized damage-inducible protein DinB
MFGDLYRDRLVMAICGLPTVLDGFLNGLPASDPRWDMHPEPGRFSLREITAHLADWDGVWLERLMLVRDQDDPPLPARDESVLEMAGDYAHSDPDVSRGLIFARRSEIVKVLRGLGDNDWERPCRHTKFGPMTLRELATYIVLHDGYHTQQVARWLMSFQVPAKAS